MNTLLKIAVRNVMRNKGRTLLSGITIAFAMFFFSAMDSLMSGLNSMGIKSMLELSTAAVKVTTKEYEEDRESLPLDYGITNQEEIQNVLKKSNRFVAATPRTLFRGQLSNYEDITPIQGIVLDPTTDPKVFTLKESVEGSFFSGESSNEIILGKKLAEELGVSIDSFVTLHALTKYDTHNAQDFKIVGLINSVDQQINSSTVILSYTAGNEFLDLEGLVTEINVALKPRNSFKDFTQDMLAVQASLQQAFPQHASQTFLELGADFLKLSESNAKFSAVFLFAILFIAAVGIFNTVLMSIFERMREIGILRAHGMTARELTSLFILEGVITGIVGAILGMVISTLAVAYLVQWGYPIDKIVPEMDAAGFPFWGTIYGIWNIPVILAGGLASIVMATVAAYFPARKAGKLTVTHALRYN